jgi:hypothetical protein
MSRGTNGLPTTSLQGYCRYVDTRIVHQLRAEGLFVEYYYGKEAGAEYLRGCRKQIENDRPIIADYHVNAEGPGDMYHKGSNVLHTIRQIVERRQMAQHTARTLTRTFTTRQSKQNRLRNTSAKPPDAICQKCLISICAEPISRRWNTT